MKNTIETVSNISKTELSARIVKSSNQLFDDYVLWHKCGWSDAEFAELLGVSAKTVQNRFKAEARKQGLIEASKFANKQETLDARGSRNREPSVENSGSDGEVIEVDVSIEDSETPNEPMPTQNKAKRPKKPEHLSKMISAQGRHIKTRLLPIAEKVTSLLDEINTEADRLGAAWEKDNIVFTTDFQECVNYWNESGRFDEFRETMKDEHIKTYADVLEKLRLRLLRASQKMETIQYSTGCIACPNKRDLKLVS